MSQDRDYYLVPDETIEVPYEVVCQPPPAESSVATIHKHELTGETLETLTLQTEGSGTATIQLSARTVEDSPLFVEFAFERADARPPRVTATRAFSLATPIPWRVEAPADAKPGEAFTATVAEWAGLAYDRPGEGTPFPGLELERVPQATQDAVKWRAGDGDLDATGCSAQVTLAEDLLGQEVVLQAFLGDAPPDPNEARATVKVPRVEVLQRHVVAAGETLDAIAQAHGAASAQALLDHAGNAALKTQRSTPAAVTTGDEVWIPAVEGTPDVVFQGGRALVRALVTPAVEGTFAWTVEGGEQVTVVQDPDDPARAELTGVTATEGEATLTVRCALTSTATSTEYPGTRAVKVEDRTVEVRFQKWPGVDGDGRGIEGLAFRTVLGDEVIQEGTTDAEGLAAVRCPEDTVTVELLWDGSPVARYGVSLRAGAAEAATTRTGHQRRLFGLGYHLGHNATAADGIDGEAGYYTDTAILNFQIDQKVDFDGTVGSTTRTKLTTAAGY